MYHVQILACKFYIWRIWEQKAKAQAVECFLTYSLLSCHLCFFVCTAFGKSYEWWKLQVEMTGIVLRSFCGITEKWIGQHFFSVLNKSFCIIHGCFSSSCGISRVNTLVQTSTWAMHNDVLLMKEGMHWLSHTCKVTFLGWYDWEFMKVNTSANESGWNGFPDGKLEFVSSVKDQVLQTP